MKKSIILIIGLIAFVLILNNFWFLTYINYSANNLIASTPDKRCNVDSDCVVKSTYCSACDCGDAVNKEWTKYCPFEVTNTHIACKPCGSENYDFNVSCVENQCTRVWNR